MCLPKVLNPTQTMTSIEPGAAPIHSSFGECGTRLIKTRAKKSLRAVNNYRPFLNQIYTMKKSNFITAFTLFLMSFLFSSCEAIAGIFKAGMGFDAFAVIGLVMLLIYVLSRMFGSKKS
jgi:multisubunit Na+/H+ antiporter MnhB subunit